MLRGLLPAKLLNGCLEQLPQLRLRYIRMPETEEEIRKIRQGFYNIARFPMCIGALDCTHVKIQSPGGDQAEIYRNRKKNF
ncbi:hypothetical protein NQ317_009125 [Molorchus minor]|uniref:Nuclease HARBI1 n=1 Tax=Molorchus minor TaxID=1323400 RepID=A0ABQ9JLE0_9CUCU|nr:hypothetical protein NQ317_009125 [Molorchus minor]